MLFFERDPLVDPRIANGSSTSLTGARRYTLNPGADFGSPEIIRNPWLFRVRNAGIGRESRGNPVLGLAGDGHPNLGVKPIVFVVPMGLLLVPAGMVYPPMSWLGWFRPGHISNPREDRRHAKIVRPSMGISHDCWALLVNHGESLRVNPVGVA